MAKVVLSQGDSLIFSLNCSIIPEITLGLIFSNIQIFHSSDTLNVKVISESCDDIAVRGKCRYARGHVFVNGYQFVSGRGANYAGIHIVLFDYLSGIFEHSQVFSILSNAAQQDALAAYLNNMPEGKILFMAARDAVSINDNLALALQKRGVSATFATTKLPKNRCSMAAVVYTGKERKSWEISVSNANCQGASIIDTKIHPFHDLQGNNDCSQEMGLRTGQLPDSRFTAASKWDVGDNFAPHQARLHNGGGSIRGWCTMNNAPVSEYLQIDFGVVQLFTGIALQGQDTTDTHCVVKFVLGYSIDGVRWETYKEDQIEKEFGGPTTMMGDILVSRFNRILARFIRVIPKQRSYSTVHCIRMEMFGCAPASPIFDDKAYTARDTYEIGNVANGQISFYAYAPISKQVTVEMSSAKHRNNLAKNTAQSHYRKVNVTTKYENGTVLSEKVGRVAILKDEKTNVKSAARIIYDLPESGFCNFDVGFTSAVSILAICSLQHSILFYAMVSRWILLSVFPFICLSFCLFFVYFKPFLRYQLNLKMPDTFPSNIKQIVLFTDKTDNYDFSWVSLWSSTSEMLECSEKKRISVDFDVKV